MNLTLSDSYLPTDGNGIFARVGPDVNGVFYVFIGAFQIINPLSIDINDSYIIEEQFINQPSFGFNDSIFIQDGLNFQLGSLLLLFDSDFFVIDDVIVQETITALSFNDLYNLNDSISTGQQNGPSFSDQYVISDTIELTSVDAIDLSDSIDITEALIFSEGFVGESEILNDSISIQDTFIIILPLVTLQVSLNDNVDNFNDLCTTSDVEMLNTYLRRYLNDVIQN